MHVYMYMYIYIIIILYMYTPIRLWNGLVARTLVNLSVVHSTQRINTRYARHIYLVGRYYSSRTAEFTKIKFCFIKENRIKNKVLFYKFNVWPYPLKHIVLYIWYSTYIVCFDTNWNSSNNGYQYDSIRVALKCFYLSY